MTDKDIRKIERTLEKVVRKIIEQEGYEAEETIIPIESIEEIEAYLGETIYFMGIS